MRGLGFWPILIAAAGAAYQAKVQADSAKDAADAANPSVPQIRPAVLAAQSRAAAESSFKNTALVVGGVVAAVGIAAFLVARSRRN